MPGTGEPGIDLGQSDQSGSGSILRLGRAPDRAQQKAAPRQVPGLF